MGSEAGRRYRLAIAAAIFVAALGALLVLTPWGRALDRVTGLEWLYALRGPIAPPREVAIVSMSKRSIDRLGLPGDLARWPRALHAKLIRQLAAQGAAVIVLDIFFRNTRQPDSDNALAAAISQSKRTVLFQRVERDTAFIDHPGRSAVVTDQLMSPIGAFAKGAAGMGPFPLPKVPARVDQFWTFNASVREVPTLPVVALQLLALRLLADVERNPAQDNNAFWGAIRSYEASSKTNDDLQRLIPRLKQIFRAAPDGEHPYTSPAPRQDTGPRRGAPSQSALYALLQTYRGPNSRIINYYGPPGTITTVPYHDIVDGGRRTGEFPNIAGKVIFVGVSDLTSTDGKDGFHTVYSRRDGIQLSGVEIMATSFANLLQGNALRQLNGPATFFVIFLFGLLVTTVAIVLNGALAIGACLAVASGMLAAAHFAFSRYGLWLPVSVPLLIQLPVALVLGSITRYVWLRTVSDRLRTRVGAFLPERVVRHITSGGPLEEIRELVYGVCLFVDLRGYTSASEGLTPESLARSTSRYYGMIDSAVEGPKSRGEVLRHSGDGAIALWDERKFGSHTDMRSAACGAALELRDAIARTSNESTSLQLPISIGLHEGEYMQGMLGERTHLEHSVLGDTINTTARLEGLNRVLGTSVLVSGEVVHEIDDLFLFRPLGGFRLAGKSEIIEVFELMQWRERCTPQEIDLTRRFAEFRKQYVTACWEQAVAIACQILECHPNDGPTEFFKSRAEWNRKEGSSDAGAPVVMDRK